jgi:hypothetical protein
VPGAGAALEELEGGAVDGRQVGVEADEAWATCCVVLLYHIIPYHIISSHIMSYCKMLLDVISYDVIRYYIITLAAIRRAWKQTELR